jgi:hypothetical protein
VEDDLFGFAAVCRETYDTNKKNPYDLRGFHNPLADTGYFVLHKSQIFV